MSKRILVIDDEPLILDLLTILLSNFGYQVDRASSAQEALRQIDTQDAIFVDIRMPGMDGKEFYERVKACFPPMARRVIFVTGDLACPQTISFIRRTGNLYLEKPFTLKEVRALLEVFSNWR